jgi:hypothetical protein
MVASPQLSAIREGFDDFLRHRQDDALNNREYTVIRNGQTVDVCMLH